MFPGADLQYRGVVYGQWAANLEGWIRDDLMRQHALMLDRDILYGVGYDGPIPLL